MLKKKNLFLNKTFYFLYWTNFWDSKENYKNFFFINMFLKILFFYLFFFKNIFLKKILLNFIISHIWFYKFNKFFIYNIFFFVFNENKLLKNKICFILKHYFYKI